MLVEEPSSENVIDTLELYRALIRRTNKSLNQQTSLITNQLWNVDPQESLTIYRNHRIRKPSTKHFPLLNVLLVTRRKSKSNLKGFLTFRLKQQSLRKIILSSSLSREHKVRSMTLSVLIPKLFKLSQCPMSYQLSNLQYKSHLRSFLRTNRKSLKRSNIWKNLTLLTMRLYYSERRQHISLTVPLTPEYHSISW